MVSEFDHISNISLSETIMEDHEEEELFLRFVLLPDTKLMLPIKQISAVLKIAYGQIIPIPEMPPWVMGVYNWRGDIIWMIDLGNLVGLTPWMEQNLTSSQHKVIIIRPSNVKNLGQSNHNSIGLVISDVEDLDSCNIQELHSPPASAITEELAPFLRGYWIKDNSDILVILDAEAILASMPKQ
jgi:positive phototaxis protein PixI